MCFYGRAAHHTPPGVNKHLYDPTNSVVTLVFSKDAQATCVTAAAYGEKGLATESPQGEGEREGVRHTDLLQRTPA